MRMLNKTYESCFHWRPENSTKLHLVDRKTGTVKSYSTDPFFFFHTINAFENDGKVVIDLCLYKSPEIIKELFLESLKENGLNIETSSKACRITIDLSKGSVSIKTLSEEILELPFFNLQHACRNYKYAYGLGIKKGSRNDVHNQLVKLNVENRESIYWYRKGHYPSEPLFISHPEAKAEDDGVVINVVLNTEKQSSYLLILDAKDLKEIASAEAPSHLPIGLHGFFYPG